MNGLDELRDLWREQGRSLDELREIEVATLAALKTERLGGSLRRWAWLPAFELAAGIVAQLWLVQFIEGVLGAPLLVASGIALFVAALVATMVAARQVFLAATVDPAGPVAEVQDRLEQLRTLRLWATRWTLLLSPLLWTPLALVLGRAMFGVDLQRAVGWPWLLANLAVGYAAIPLGLRALARASRRWGASAAWQRLREDVAGRSLARARRSLEEIAAFRKEPA
ncbi:MAG TPA: hypothetical protein VFF12_03740 [Myxococcaceae bacterium]|nr:hypothetical protein [Myxococcaceae bacterium]